MPKEKISNADRRLVIRCPGDDLRTRNPRDYDVSIPSPQNFLESQKKDPVILETLLKISHALRVVSLVSDVDDQKLVQALGDSLNLPVEFQARVAEKPAEKISKIHVTCMDRRLNLQDHPELSSAETVRVAGGNFLLHPEISEALKDVELVRFISREIPNTIVEKGLTVESFSNHTTMGDPLDCGAVKMAQAQGLKIKGPEHYVNLLLESAEHYAQEYGNVISDASIKLYVLDVRHNVVGALDLRNPKHTKIFIGQNREEMQALFDEQKILNRN